MDIVDYSKIEKKLNKLPKHILDKLYKWIAIIKKYGWLDVKNIEKYKDHTLKGHHKGKRSARLDRSYRIIYKVIKNKEVYAIMIEGVTKHDYRKK